VNASGTDSGANRDAAEWFELNISGATNDDMSLWSIGEYATSTANRWGTFVADLLAPAPTLVNPAGSATVGQSGVVLNLTGTGFFDPGVGFANRLAVQLTGGATNGISNYQLTWNSPTSVTLTFDIAPGATPGARNIVLTNPDGQSVTVVGGFTVNAASGAIAGQTYEDRNGNGALDAGDVPLNGVTVFLDADNDGVIDGGEPSLVTAGSGNYTFGSLAPDSYIVRELIPAGYIATSPANGVSVVNVSAGTTTQNFGSFPIVYGDGGNDDYLLRLDAGTSSKLEILLGGVLTWTIAKASVPSLTFDTAAGDDVLTIDAQSGNPIPTGGVTYTAGANTAAGDKLALVGSPAPDTATFGTASATFNGSIIANTGVETTSFDGQRGLDTVSVNSGQVLFPATQQLLSLSIASSATVVLQSGSSRAIYTRNLSLSGTARLDLGDNDLLWDYTGSTPIGTLAGSTYTGVTGMIQSARNNGSAIGNWTGPGITTSAFVADYKTLGVAESSQVNGTATLLWSGETIDSTTVIVKYTYGGDANLDGKINILDYTRIDSSLASNLSAWFNGDFNYDGKLNIVDYASVIDSNIATQGPPL
jgi:hypothetical protein